MEAAYSSSSGAGSDAARDVRQRPPLLWPGGQQGVPPCSSSLRCVPKLMHGTHAMAAAVHSPLRLACMS